MTPAGTRGLVWAGSVVAGALAAGVLVSRAADLTPGREAADLLGGLALAALMLVPVGLALHALRVGRPTQLRGAIVVLGVGSVALFTLAPVAVLAILAWIVALSRWDQRTSRPRVGALGLAAIAAAAAVASLFVHVDPYCWERLSGDHGVEAVRAVPPDDPSGLRWSTATASSSGSETEAGGSDVAASGCGSDRIVPAEAIASMALVAVAARAVTRTSAAA